MKDQRRHQRIRMLEFGKIVDRHATGVDCIVRNMSAEGACLQVNDSAGLPEEFYLKIPLENVTRACRVAWKAGDRLGVAFVGRNAQRGQSA